MSDVMDRSTATDPVSAGGRQSPSQHHQMTNMYYLLAFVIVAVVIVFFLMRVSHNREVNRLKDEKTELQRASYQRELNGLAGVNETNTVYTVQLSDQSPTGFWAVSTTDNGLKKGKTTCERPMFVPDGEHFFPYFEDEVALEDSPDGAYCSTRVPKPGG